MKSVITKTDDIILGQFFEFFADSENIEPKVIDVVNKHFKELVL